LKELCPDPNAKIPIDCNNNFEGDQFDFASKVAWPSEGVEKQILSNRKPAIRVFLGLADRSFYFRFVFIEEGDCRNC